MAAEIVGTAYVRVRAITAGLAKDISDGVDRGVKDAGPDIDKSGEDVGDRLGESAGKSFRGSMAEGIGDGIDSPDVRKRFERGGENATKSVRRGVDKETKRSSPFKSLSDSFKKLGDSFKGFDPGPIGWVGLLSPATLTPVVGLVVASLASVTAALGFVVTAAAGAGVALAGVAAVALPGLAVLFAAFKTNTPQLERFKKRAEELLKPWKEIGVATQKTLLPGLEGALRRIRDLVPMFAEFGSDLGGIVGNWVEFAAATLTNEKNMGALSTILAESTEFFDLMGEAFVRLMDAMLPFLAAAAPLATDLADGFVSMATSFQDFVNRTSESGELTNTLQTWWDRAKTLWDILVNVGASLWNILSIAGETATPFFDRVKEVTQGWQDFTGSEEGKNRIQQFFLDAQPVMDEVWRLIKNIWDLIAAGPEGDTEGAAAFSETFETLAGAMDKVNEVLENPITKQLAPYLLTTLIGLKGLSLLNGPLSALASTFTILAASMDILGLSLKNLAIYLGPVAVIALMFFAAWKFWPEIEGFIKSAWEWFTKLNTPLKILVGTFLGFTAIILGPFAALPATILLVVGAIKHWDEIVEIAQRAYDAIVNFVTGLPELLSGIPEALLGVAESIGEFFTGLPEQLAGLGAALGEFFTGLAESLGRFFTKLGPTLKEGLLNFLQDLPNLMLDALGALGELGLDIIGLIADGLQAALPAMGQFFVELPVKIMEFIGGVLSDIIPIGASIIANIITGLAKALPEILTFFVKLPIEIATIMRRVTVEIIKFGVEMVVALVKGIGSAAPRVFQWFKDLPGNIIQSAGAVASWLLETGKLVLQGMLDGFTNVWPNVKKFFTDLPGNILSALSNVGGFLVSTGALLLNGLWDGIQEVWGSIKEFFGTLPGQIVTAMGDFFGLIWSGISSGVAAFYTNIDNWILGLVTFFIELPGRILTAIGDLGGAIWGFISGGFATTAASIATWIAERLVDFANFVIDLPGKLVDFGANLIKNIASGMADAIPGIATWISERLTDFGNFVSDLPGKLVDFGSNLIKNIVVGLDEAKGKITTWISDRLDDIGKFVTDIPGELLGLASNLADGVGRALKRAWNTAVDSLPGGTFDPLGAFGPSITVDFGFLKMETGGIIPGSALGIPIVAGEHFRSEAVVPMTRPSRALTVLQEAGLDRLVLDAYFKGRVPGQTAPAGEVTMLRIDKAVMTAPVDADLVVQKVTAAYTRMAS